MPKKKLTLDETWKQCLKMWRWIVKQKKLHPYSEVNVLKRKWFRKYSPRDSKLAHCFFCDYNKANHGGYCRKCPATVIDQSFYCGNSKYHFAYEPTAFLKEITRLNKIRLKEKRNDRQ